MLGVHASLSMIISHKVQTRANFPHLCLAFIPLFTARANQYNTCIGIGYRYLYPPESLSQFPAFWKIITGCQQSQTHNHCHARKLRVAKLSYQRTGENPARPYLRSPLPRSLPSTSQGAMTAAPKLDPRFSASMGEADMLLSPSSAKAQTVQR